jgi:hypothetical protein
LDPAGPTNCALATCGDGFVQAGVEPCDGGPTCTPSCCVYLPGYQIGILGAQCQEELLKTSCDYSMCGRAGYIQKQIDRYDDQLEKIERQIEEARLNGAARRAANLARKLGRMEARLSRFCPESLEAQECLRSLMDDLGDVLAPLEDNLLLVVP